ncbi:Ribokinase-like protein [Podospora didyma]|uniref:Ribokinase-like protein n=1 Tax=Podospora didyma TaxID=330526 RepID=A0AAE0U3K8_9PEZI|nr:Ribokinase-like protein [Podospora didyma]
MSLRESLRSQLKKMISNKHNRRGSINSNSGNDNGDEERAINPLNGLITVVGSVNMDSISLVGLHPGPNRHVLADKLIKMPGGHGLNQAIACVRLSHRSPGEPDLTSASGAGSHSASEKPLLPHDIDVSVKLVGMVDGARHLQSRPRLPVPEDLWRVDHVIMNASRADVDCDGHEERRSVGSAAGQDMGSGSRIVKAYWDDCEHFHELGARCVVITMGQKGAIASVRERSRKDRPRMIHSGVLVPKGPVKVRDTTGASDAFIGAYAVEILRQIKANEEENISRAMEMGIKAVGCTVTNIGSMDSIPWRDDVLNREFDGVEDPSV